MATLDSLMQLNGALAAFEYNDKGEIVTTKIADPNKINDDVIDLLSHVCVANQAIATMQARGWQKVTGMQGFYPVQGLSLVGFDWTVVTNDHKGVVLANATVDFDAAYAALGA